jgi:hypothetical protein
MKLNGLTRGKLGKVSTRRKLAGALALLLALGLLAGLTVPTFAIQPPSQRFAGDVTFAGGTQAPVDTEVKAVVNSVEFFAYVDASGRYGDSPKFYVEADDPDTTTIIEGGTTGDIISFYVDDIFVTTCTFESGGHDLDFDLEAPIDVPPTVVSTLPGDGAEDVDPDAVVSATFSEDIQEGTNFGDIGISGATGVSASIAGDTLTIAHDDFDEDTTYVVTIPAGAVNDMTDNPLADDYIWSFTTGIRIPELEVVSTLPVNGATGVAPDAVVSATFSEDIQEGTNFDDIDISGATGVTPSIAGDILTIAHDDFDEDTTYVVTIPAGAVGDLTGNPLASEYTWSFYTGIPTTLDLCEGVNIIAYTGATADLPEALTNIGPDGLDVVDIIWVRGAWTGGEWMYYNAIIQYGVLSQLEAGRAYIIVVTEDCAWELLQ